MNQDILVDKMVKNIISLTNIIKKDDKEKVASDGKTEDKKGAEDAVEKKDTKAKAETTDKDEKASNKTTTTTAKPKKDY